MVQVTQPLRGKTLLDAVVKQITEYPETWDQTVWHSFGGQRCVAGWAQVLGGLEVDSLTTPDNAQGLLGLNIMERQYLFHPERTLQEIQEFANAYQN